MLKVLRLESQVKRYRSAAEGSEKVEDDLKQEKRKLQREVSKLQREVSKLQREVRKFQREISESRRLIQSFIEEQIYGMKHVQNTTIIFQ